MARVFILSDTYYERIFSCIFPYIANLNVEEIILLKENHNSDVNLNLSDTNHKITILDTYVECINKCDFIILIKNNNLPKHTIETTLCNAVKPVYLLDMTAFEWNMNSIETMKTSIDSFDQFSKTPVILHITMGITAMPIIIEVLLGQALHKNNIKFKQYYLDSSLLLLKQIYESKLLNNEFSAIFDKSFHEKSKDINIVTIDIGNSIDNIYNYIELIKKINADFIFLSTYERFNDVINADNYIKYGCQKRIDFYIKSPYSIVNNNCLIENHEQTMDDRIYSIYDKDLKEILLKKILIKLSLPDGIKKIKI